MCVCACVHVFVHVCACMCGGVAKWLKCLTTEQKVPGSSPTMQCVCVCVCVCVHDHVENFQSANFMFFAPVKSMIQRLVTITSQNLPSVYTYNNSTHYLNTVISHFSSWKCFGTELVDQKLVTRILFHYKNVLHLKMFSFGYLEREHEHVV